jgi:hypothetical protein
LLFSFEVTLLSIAQEFCAVLRDQAKQESDHERRQAASGRTGDHYGSLDPQTRSPDAGTREILELQTT